MNMCPFLHIRLSLAESKIFATQHASYTGFLFRCSPEPSLSLSPRRSSPPRSPQVGSIEVPDTTVGIALPFHPGATAYYNGDPPNLLEMFEDYVYLMAIIGSVIGAVVAWILSAWRRALSPDQEQLLRLLAIVRDVPAADPDTLEALDKEVEAIHACAVERGAHEAIEPEQFQVVSQVVTEVRQVHRQASHRTALSSGKQEPACYEENHMRHEENHMCRHVCRHRTTCAWALVLGLAALIWQAPRAPSPWTFPHLGGRLLVPPPAHRQLGGLRDELGKKGVVVDIDLPCKTPQGVVSGGRDELGRYWGLAEYTLNVDTQKLGLWPGGFLRVQGMSSFGQNVNVPRGALVSPNMVSLLPEPGGPSTGLMDLTFMQFFSKHFGVLLGKINGLSADDNAFAHDYHSTFMNTALDFNMTLDLFPFTAYGGGLVILPWDGAVFTLGVLDPNGTARDNSLSDAFDDGVLVAAEHGSRSSRSAWSATSFWGAGGATRSASRSSRIGPTSRPAPPNRAVPSPVRSWPGPPPDPRRASSRRCSSRPAAQARGLHLGVYYNFDQYLWSPEGAPTSGIGIFFRFGASDGEANPIKYSLQRWDRCQGSLVWRPCDSSGSAGRARSSVATSCRSCASSSGWASAMRTPSSCITMPRSPTGSARRSTCRSSIRHSKGRWMRRLLGSPT